MPFLYFIYCETGFADNYHFKNCKLGNNLTADYLINLDKKEIKVKFISEDGKSQELVDKIVLISPDRIVSKKIQSKTGKDYYFQYYLDSKSKSVTRQRYKKKDEFFNLDGPKQKSICNDVKADWNEKKGKKSKKKDRKKEIKKLEISVPKCEGDNFIKWSDCQGSYTTENGLKFVGQFENGKIFKGTAFYPGGSEYSGEFNNNEPHGQGTFIYSDGSKHLGEFKEGKGSGHGIKTWKNGKEYAGEFLNDLPHGQGTFSYPDGSKYTGEFKNGKRSGQGTIQYSNGATFMGEFVNGVEVGKGTCFNKDGLSIECKMLNTTNELKTSGKNMHNISIDSDKWIKSEDKPNEEARLKIEFDKKAREICSSSGKFKIIQKRIEILDVSEKTEWKFIMSRDIIVEKIGINGFVECE